MPPSGPSPYAFVIMPIGRPQLDKLLNDAIRPAIEDERFGLKARRVDQDHEGGMLGSHILDFIDGATLLVADLTHARPNVYLEVGYALRAHQHHETGTRKNPRLILMAREDHNKESPNFKNGTPEKIHFDLEAYGILWWTDAADYKRQLTAEIDRRLKMIERLGTSVAAVAPVVPPVIDMDWIDARQSYVNLHTRGLDAARTEFASGVRHGDILHKSAKDLLAVVKTAPRYGYWVAHAWNTEEFAPKALARGGIHATSPHGWAGTQYWALNRDGQFFRASSLTEDSSSHGEQSQPPGSVLWIDARIREFVETLVFVARTYKELGVPDGSEVQFRYGIVGLARRHVGGVERRRWWPSEKRTTEENEYAASGAFPLGSLAGRVIDLVIATLEPLFVMFELDTEWERIIRDVTQDVMKDVNTAGL